MAITVAVVSVSGVYALASCVKPIPKGIIGAEVRFMYTDPLWDTLQKTVVFSCGGITKDILNAGNTVEIPAEIVAQQHHIVKVGIYGTDADGKIAIPTLWADLGMVRDAADPSGDESTDPELPVWAQLAEQIAKLQGANKEEIETIVKECLLQNPPEVEEADPTVPDWAKGEEKPKYTASEVGALSSETLSEAINTALALAKESGAFKGEPGEPGPQGPQGEPGYPGAPGEKGDPGYTPQKGTDYYTETDKAEMVNSVLSALPTWTGGSF